MINRNRHAELAWHHQCRTQRQSRTPQQKALRKRVLKARDRSTGHAARIFQLDLQLVVISLIAIGFALDCFGVI